MPVPRAVRSEAVEGVRHLGVGAAVEAPGELTADRRAAVAAFDLGSLATTLDLAVQLSGGQIDEPGGQLGEQLLELESALPAASGDTCVSGHGKSSAEGEVLLLRIEHYQRISP